METAPILSDGYARSQKHSDAFQSHRRSDGVRAARIGGVNNRIVPIHFIDCVNLIRSSHYDLDIRKTYDAIGRNPQI